jgi:hypothetical protein
MIVIPSAKPRLTYNPRAEIAEFGTKRSSVGNFGAFGSFQVSSYTGWFKVNWWDGTSTLYNPGIGNSIVTKAIASPYDTTAEKRFSIIPTNSSGVQIGQLSLISLGSSTYSPISYVDVLGLSKLETFYCQAGTNLTSYTHNGRIKYLTLSNTGLTSLSIPPRSLTERITIDSNQSLTALNGLDNVKNTLQELALTTCLSFTSAINLSNYPALYNIDIRGSVITSLRAQNCTLNSQYYSSSANFIGGAKLDGSSLDRTAIVQFFNDLANGNGYLNVSGSIGAASLTASDILIATNKGYTVLNIAP